MPSGGGGDRETQVARGSVRDGDRLRRCGNRLRYSGGCRPINTGTVSICLDKAAGAECDVFNGSVGLAPSPQLISNTLYHTSTEFFGLHWSDRVRGTVQAVSTGGQTATLTINVQRLFRILELGSIRFVDPGSGIAVNLQVLYVTTDNVWCTIWPGAPCEHRWRTYGESMGIFGALFPGNITGVLVIT